MSEMVEKVAVALFEADYPGKAWGRFGPSDDDAARYFRRARAAIEAMREPNEVMHKAAWLACDRVNEFADMNEQWPAYNSRVYRAMIDAALSEEAR